MLSSVSTYSVIQLKMSNINFRILVGAIAKIIKNHLITIRIRIRDAIVIDILGMERYTST